MEIQMKTAEELYEKTFDGLNIEDNEHLIPQIMIEFAKMHVKAALEAASIKVDRYNYSPNVVLNAYPETNIK